MPIDPLQYIAVKYYKQLKLEEQGAIRIDRQALVWNKNVCAAGTLPTRHSQGRPLALVPHDHDRLPSSGRGRVSHAKPYGTGSWFIGSHDPASQS